MTGSNTFGRVVASWVDVNCSNPLMGYLSSRQKLIGKITAKSAILLFLISRGPWPISRVNWATLLKVWSQIFVWSLMIFHLIF